MTEQQVKLIAEAIFKHYGNNIQAYLGDIAYGNTRPDIAAEFDVCGEFAGDPIAGAS